MNTLLELLLMVEAIRLPLEASRLLKSSMEQIMSSELKSKPFDTEEFGPNDPEAMSGSN